MYSKGGKTGGITYSDEQNSLKEDVATDDDAELETNPSHDSSNMIIVNLASIFQEMEQELREKGKTRIEAIEKKYQQEDEDEES